MQHSCSHTTNRTKNLYMFILFYKELYKHRHARTHTHKRNMIQISKFWNQNDQPRLCILYSNCDHLYQGIRWKKITEIMITINSYSSQDHSIPWYPKDSDSPSNFSVLNHKTDFIFLLCYIDSVIVSLVLVVSNLCVW
jgi:hypothetical protein